MYENSYQKVRFFPSITELIFQFDIVPGFQQSSCLILIVKCLFQGSVIVQGLEIVSVKSMEEVYAILEKGCKKRRKAVTLLNKASSRSHTIFTVTVSSRESSATLQKVKNGKLNLVRSALIQFSFKIVTTRFFLYTCSLIPLHNEKLLSSAIPFSLRSASLFLSPLPPHHHKV